MAPLMIAIPDFRNPIGGSISSFTASNIISNLGLSMAQTLDEHSYVAAPGATDPRCNGTSSGTRCQLAIQFAGGCAVLFNANSIAFQEVPGPLPILSACTAFAFSRKLRTRIKASQPTVQSI